MKKRNLFKALVFILFVFSSWACRERHLDIAKYHFLEELQLGDPLDEVTGHWWLFSKKPFRLDATVGRKKLLTYRGVSRDASVTTLLFHFDFKTRRLMEVEWRFRPSLAQKKQEELRERFERLWGKPKTQRHFGGGVSWLWRDKEAEVEIFGAEGICQLFHRLRRPPKPVQILPTPQR